MYSVLCTALYENPLVFRVMYCFVCKSLVILYYVLLYMQIPWFTVLCTALYANRCRAPVLRCRENTTVLAAEPSQG